MDSVTTLPRSEPLTAADLATMPDDGHRYELLDGSLIVTPAPRVMHQQMSLRLAILLSSAAPTGLTVLTAPLDVALDDVTVLQPDLLVAPTAAFTERNLPTAPLLAVEILSPSTRAIDLGAKKLRYETARCPNYWVIDPDEPSLTAWHLDDTAYGEPTHRSNNELFQTDSPFPISFTPASLRT